MALALGITLVVGVAACGGRKRGPAPGPAPAVSSSPASLPTAAPARAASASMKAFQGPVEVKRQGRLMKVTPGVRLDQDDIIRTAAGGSATVGVGEDVEVELQQSSEVTLREVTANASRVRLERGRLGANVASDKVVLRVESTQSSAIAEARRGRFAVFTDGKGLVAVAATAGEVKLSSSGGDSVLAAGQRALVVQDHAPRVEPVPSSVYLKVRWPEAVTQKTVVVRGSSDVGAIVAVNGALAPVAGDGTFTATVPVDRGKRKIEVVATDLIGRTASASGTVLVTRALPKIKVERPVWK